MNCPKCNSEKVNIEYSEQYKVTRTWDGVTMRRKMLTMVLHNICVECGLKYEMS